MFPSFQLYGEDLPTEAPQAEPAEAEGASGAKKDAGSEQGAKEEGGAPPPPPPAEANGGEDEDEDEDFDIVLGEAAGGKEGASDDDDGDLDIVLNATAGGEAPGAGADALTSASGSAPQASAADGAKVPSVSDAAPAKTGPAAPANSQFRWTRGGAVETKPPPPPPGSEPGVPDGFTHMMHPNPSSRPIWMPQVPKEEHKDAAFPSQAKPGQPIKLPGQTR